MNKIIIGVVTVIAVAAGAGAFVVTQGSKKTYSLEDLLPVQPSFYVRTKNLTQRMDNFTKTKLFQDLNSIDYNKAAAAYGAPSDGVNQVRDALGKAFSPENQKMFKALFGNDAAVAIYTNDLKTFKTADPQSAVEALSNVFIATRLSPEMASVETVTRFLGLFNKDLKVEVEKYNGKDINLLKSADGAFVIGYVRFGDILVMGVGQKAARAAIDVEAKKQKPLAGDEEYLKRVKMSYDGTQTFGYFNIKTIYPLLTEEITQLAKSEEESAVYKVQLEEQLKQIQGLEALVFSSKPSLREPNGGDVIAFKADLLYNAAELNPDVKAYYACKPQDNQSVKFVPAEALTYQWNSCLDFPIIWRQYKDQLAMQGRAAGQNIDVNEMVGTYEQMIGVSIERDVLPVLGKEFGLYIKDVTLTTVMPMPQIVFFIDTTGREAADALINKLLALQPALQFEEQKYSDATIRYIPIPIAEGLALSTTYIGNTLLVASSVDVLKASLDAVKDSGKSIGSNAAFKTTDGKKNSVFFVQVDRSLQKVEAVADWVQQSAKQNQIQRQAFLTGSQKNLADIRARNEELKIKIAANQDIEAAQNELAANEEKEKNLSDQIAAYETKAPKEDSNQQAINDLIKPLVNALENIKYFTATTVNGDGILSSIVQIKIE